MKYTEGGYHWQYVKNNVKKVAYSVRREDGDELVLISPCQDTVLRLLGKGKQYDYYLGKIWEHVSND